MKKLIWALFGNDEDSIYGRPDQGGYADHTAWNAIKFWLRNPFHNLTHHTLNWPNGPFWKLQGRQMYVGWRPGGNLGIKLQPWIKD